MDLKPISIEDKCLFDEKINYSFTNSEATFANLFMWRKTSKTKYALVNDALCVFYTKSNGCTACCYPMGECDITDTIDKINDIFKSNNACFLMESVTEEYKNVLTQKYGDEIIAKELPSLFDYVYKTEKLINLSGKKLHSKRNHINKFKSLYNYKFDVLDKNYIDECIACSKKWLNEKYGNNTEDFIDEFTAIREALTNFDVLKLQGGVLLVDGEIVAFTLGEKLTDNTFVTHIEKANTNFEGAYAVINNEFAQNVCKDYEFINREEDMGLEGIRKAKLSYYPDLMIKKYSIKFKEM